MAVINSSVSFNVIFGTPDGVDPIVVPGSVPRPDGLVGCMYRVVQGQQTIPWQVFTNSFFQEFVATGQVTIISNP
jgi:hypothetical protein